MKKRWTGVFFVLFCLSCGPDKAPGQIDAQVLSVVLESKKTIYEYGETIQVRAKVSSQLSTVRLYEWYTDGRYEAALLTERYEYTPTEIRDTSYRIKIDVKVRVGIYTATDSISIQVNPPVPPDFEWTVNGTSPQTQLLLFNETLTTSVEAAAGSDIRSCHFFWDSILLNPQSAENLTLTMDESRFGTHTFSVEVSDGVSTVRRSCTVKVGPVLGAVITAEAGNINALFGDDLQVSAGVRMIEDFYRFLSAEWFIGEPQSDFLTSLSSFQSEDGKKLDLPGNSEWMRPANSENGVRWRLKIEFRFKQLSTGQKITFSDSVFFNIAPYTPLKIEHFSAPETVSFYEWRNGLAVVEAVVSGGRSPVEWHWRVDGSQEEITNQPSWIVPCPLTEWDGGSQRLIELKVTDGISELEKSFRMNVTFSDAPLIRRFYEGESIEWQAADGFDGEVFFIISKAIDESPDFRVRSASRGRESEPALRQKAAAAAVGAEKKTFTVSDLLTPATLRFSSYVARADRILEIWVADNLWGSTGINDADVKEIAERFLPQSGKGIYDETTAILGKEWGNLANILYLKYINPEETIAVLLCDIDGDQKTDFSEGAVAGIFEPEDCFLRTFPPFTDSDEKLMVALDAPLLRSEKETVYSTLAHEFAHLITFYQKEVSAFSGQKMTETWLSEMISMCVEDLLAESMGWKGPRGVLGLEAPDYPPYVTVGRLPLFIADPTLSPAPDNFEKPSIYENYAAAYAFGAWLIRNYPHPELLNKIVKNSDDGVKAVLTGLRNCGFDVSLEDLFADFATAVVLSDFKNLPAVSRKRYNAVGGFSYSETVSAGAIDLNAYIYESQSGPRFSAGAPHLEAPSENYSQRFYRMTAESGYSPVSGTVPDGCTLTVVEK